MDKNANYTVDRDINMIKCYPVLFVIFCDGLHVQQIAFSRLLKQSTREARQKKVCCPRSVFCPFNLPLTTLYVNEEIKYNTTQKQRGNSPLSISLSWRDQSPRSLLTRLFVSSKTNDETNLRIGPKELSEFTRHPGVVWVSRHQCTCSQAACFTTLSQTDLTTIFYSSVVAFASMRACDDGQSKIQDVRKGHACI